MRAGSSLLLHLLLTNPDISGCGERNSQYLDDQDLIKLAIKSNIGQRKKRWASYSVDQINHTHLVQSKRLLVHPSVFPIILIREPREAIGSMVDVLGQFYDFGINDALTYYHERISTLTRYAELIRPNGRLMSLTYAELVADTQNTLLRLRDYLGLGSELSDHYSTFDFTGTRGDPSSRIQAGRVLTKREHHDCNINSADLDELSELYDNCLDALRCDD